MDRLSSIRHTGQETAFGEITPRFPQGDFGPTTPPKEEIWPKFRIARDSGATRTCTTSE